MQPKGRFPVALRDAISPQDQNVNDGYAGAGLCPMQTVNGDGHNLKASRRLRKDQPVGCEYQPSTNVEGRNLAPRHRPRGCTLEDFFKNSVPHKQWRRGADAA